MIIHCSNCGRGVVSFLGMESILCRECWDTKYGGQPVLESQMKKVCAWCELVMDPGFNSNEVTHGICPPCFGIVMSGGDITKIVKVGA